jgi:hypothetical protein
MSNIKLEAMKKEMVRILNMYKLKCYTVKEAQKELLDLYNVGNRFSFADFSIGLYVGIFGTIIALSFIFQ